MESDYNDAKLRRVSAHKLHGDAMESKSEQPDAGPGRIKIWDAPVRLFHWLLVALIVVPTAAARLLKKSSRDVTENTEEAERLPAPAAPIDEKPHGAIGN